MELTQVTCPEERFNGEIRSPNSPSGEEKPSLFFYLDPSCDSMFWTEVDMRMKLTSNLENLTCDLIDNIRVDRIIKDFDRFQEDSLQDPVLVMMTSWYDEFASLNSKDFNFDEYLFEEQVTRLAKVILKRKYNESYSKREKCRYSKYFVLEKETGIRKTILHVAAEGYRHADNSTVLCEKPRMKRNFSEIAECLINYDPGLVYATTEGEKWEKLPLELALLHFDDQMASLLIKHMSNKNRVRMLFEYNYSRGEPSKFRFIDYIERRDMKRTVVAVLDCLIDPQWSLPLGLSQNKHGKKEGQELPETPSRYRLNFRLIDGDFNGRRYYLDRIQNGSFLKDEHYQVQQNSCLRALCLSSEHAITIRHPVVRFLSRRKWNDYGRLYSRFQFFLYCIHYVSLAIALLGAALSGKLTIYHTNFEKIRLFAEIISFLFSLSYGVIDLDQLRREGHAYWRDLFNYLDVLGTFSLLALLAMRWLDFSEQWSLAAFSFMCNSLRIFKYFSAFRGTGIYVRILAALIKDNVPVFLSVSGVMILSLSGGSFLVLKPSSFFNAKMDSFDQTSIRFSDSLLRSFRAVAEGQAFSETYCNYSNLAILIILGNMVVLTLVLVNIFIAQLSESYARAHADATAQYDVAKAIFTTRIENSWIPFLRFREKYYKEDCFVSETELVKGWLKIQAKHINALEKTNFLIISANSPFLPYSVAFKIFENCFR